VVVDSEAIISGSSATQFLENPDTLRKHEAARNWCKKRGMNFIVATKK